MAPALEKVRRLTLEAVVAIGIFALMVAISEGLFRLFLAPRGKPVASSPAPDPGLPRLHRTRDLAQPDVRGINAGALYETNSDGFRGPEREREKAPGVLRVAVIGDSTAMGWGVEEEDTYAARLERTLNDDPAAPAFEVLNFAMAGHNGEAIVKRLEDLGLPYAPDVVIYGFALNDIKGDHYRASLDPEYTRSLFEHESNSRLWEWLRPLWLAFRERTFTPRGTFAYELDDNYFDNPNAWGSLENQMQKLAGLGEKNNFCTLLLVQAQIESLNFLHPYGRHYEVVEKLGSQNGFHVLHSLGPLSEADASDLWVTDLDHHANAKGHAIFADILADGLARLPDTCWDPKTVPRGTSKDSTDG